MGKLWDVVVMAAQCEYAYCHSTVYLEMVKRVNFVTYILPPKKQTTSLQYLGYTYTKYEGILMLKFYLLFI